MLLYQLLAFTIHGNIYESPVIPPIWNEEFELPNGSYLLSVIQDYFEYILKKHGGKDS